MLFRFLGTGSLFRFEGEAPALHLVVVTGVMLRKLCEIIQHGVYSKASSPT